VSTARLTEEQRELLVFDALRVSLGYVHGIEREQVCRSLCDAGMVLHRAPDGCESWHKSGSHPPAACPHGLALVEVSE
jgi:hypothetical protein